MDGSDEKILSLVRMVGGEFAEASDEEVRLWVELQKPAVSEKKFGADYHLAIALLVCHAMKMAGKGSTGFGSIADTGRVASVSEGGTSVSFATTTAGATGDAEYQLTSYGAQFITLRNRHIIPIVIR